MLEIDDPALSKPFAQLAARRIEREQPLVGCRDEYPPGAITLSPGHLIVAYAAALRQEMAGNIGAGIKFPHRLAGLRFGGDHVAERRAIVQQVARLEPDGLHLRHRFGIERPHRDRPDLLQLADIAAVDLLQLREVTALIAPAEMRPVACRIGSGSNQRACSRLRRFIARACSKYYRQHRGQGQRRKAGKSRRAWALPQRIDQERQS